MIEYKYVKDFQPIQLEELFRSVNWLSGRSPEKLKIAFQNSSNVISAWDGTTLIGLIRGMDDSTWQVTIDCLLVHSDYQRQGIASRLLNLLLEKYTDFLYINVTPDEEKNVAFYQKHGFERLGKGTALQYKGKPWK